MHARPRARTHVRTRSPCTFLTCYYLPHALQTPGKSAPPLPQTPATTNHRTHFERSLPPACAGADSQLVEEDRNVRSSRGCLCCTGTCACCNPIRALSRGCTLCHAVVTSVTRVHSLPDTVQRYRHYLAQKYMKFSSSTASTKHLSRACPGSEMNRRTRPLWNPPVCCR